MYKTSPDRRFQKNKKAITRAYLDLVVEKQSQNISISEIAERADINRMTFYSHYDKVDDIFDEYVDGIVSGIGSRLSSLENVTLDDLFSVSNEYMAEEIEFFRYAANNPSSSNLRNAFKKGFADLIKLEFDDKKMTAAERTIRADLTSCVISYGYLDWLAGYYGDISLDELLEIMKKLLTSSLISSKGSELL